MSGRIDRPIKLRVCMRPGCGRTVKKPTDRFCSPAHRRADYAEHMREKREADKGKAAAYKARVDAAVQEILRKEYYCPSCEPEKGPKPPKAGK